MQSCAIQPDTSISSLPTSVPQCTSIALFKSKLKSRLFTLYHEYECSATCSRARLVFVKLCYKSVIVLYCVAYRWI